MKRKTLALILSVALFYSFSSNTVFAVEMDNTKNAVVENFVIEAENAETTEEEFVDETTKKVEQSKESVELLSSGECGENLVWTLTEDGTLTISGNGDINSEPWDEEKNEITTLIIEDGVTGISDRAFSECFNLNSVQIADSVTCIGKGAFENCESLLKIVIPSKVSVIEDETFHGCNTLANITLPANLVSIGEWAFYGCDFPEIHLPNSLTSIGEMAFFLCDKLEEITIPNSVTHIGGGAFEKCKNLNKVTLPDKLETISEALFYECTSLEEISIPNSVITIETAAFAYCPFETITIPDNVKEIGERAFESTDLKEISIPNGIKNIKNRTFYYCTNLEKVNLPESVSKIEKEAFLNTPLLESITLSANIKALGKNSFGYEEVFDEEYEIVPIKGFTIYGYLGTTAETYANTNGFSFRNLGEEGTPNTLVIVHEKSENTYEIGSGDDLTIYCTGDFEKFDSVEMDGVLVDPSNYEVEEGSTIITFSASYLDTLSPGKHKVTINYVDDSISTYINITGDKKDGIADEESNDDSTMSTTNSDSYSAAKTGDTSSIVMWFVLGITALGTVILLGVKSRKF